MQDKESDQKVPETQRFGSSLESLKASLQKSWNDRYIHIQYQNSVMGYINKMDAQQAKQQLISEQSKLISNKSVALKIQSMINQRESLLASLLQNLEGQVNLDDDCQLIDQLRKINLKVCETIFGLREALQKRNLNGQSVIKGYSSFFKKLNTDNVPIVHSYLKDFINFTNNYDPLFMHPYQTIQAEGNIQDLPQSVGKLFKMNISYVYRLIKIKNQLVKCLSLVNLINSNQFQSQMKRQNQCQESLQQNRSLIRGEAPKKILMIRARKYETISYEQPEEVPPANRKFIRRYISKSEPKNSNIKTIDAARSEEQQDGQIPKLRKFKIRDLGDKSKTSNVRFRTENYDITEDEDINVFRRKMRVRRERRKRINITQRRDSSQSEQQIASAKKNSLEIKRLSNFSETYKLKSKTQVFDRLDEESESSSDGELLEPRGLDDKPANLGLAQRFGKIRSLESSKIRQGLRNKKERIKLQPISEYASKQSERQSIQKYTQVNDAIDSPNQRRLQKYFSLSPEIKQMNKQSSSGRSDNKQQQAYTGERQQQLFKDINKKSQQKLNSSKNAFRLKKIIPTDATNSHLQRTSWAESEDIIPIEETNESKFKDGHIRRLKGLDIQNQKRQSQIREKEDNSFSRVSQKQSPSRLGNHIKDGSKKSSKEPLIKKQKLQDFSFRQKYNNQESSMGSIGKNTQQDKKQKILQQIEQQLEQNPNKKKEIKMKPGEIKLADLYSFIEKQKINEFQRKQFEVGLWKENIDLKHSYLTKFYMNSELAAFGISSPRCDGDFSILYWGTTCAESFTSFLFRKYLDYLQKFTSLNNIYIGNPGYCDADFVQKGSNFIRGRKKFDKRQLPYIPFLSFECSNICFEQKTVDTQLSIFFSEQIQQFNDQNAKASKFIVMCNPQLQKLKYPQQSMFYKSINSISQVNKILEQSKIDTYATSQKIKIEQCKLFTLKDSCTIKSNYFYVRNGYFVPQGRQVYAKDKQKIVKLDMNKQDYSLYFGKKFHNIQMFVSSCQVNNSGSTQFFAFKMFSKQLYGRIKTGQYASLGCYGNWDINFLWQDQLKGTVIKEMPSSELTYGPDNFFVAIYKSEMLLFAFEVKPSDFFF